MSSEQNPVQELLKLRNRMNRLFEESMGRFSVLGDGEDGGWAPAVDIYEDGERVIFEVELPGVPRESVTVAVEDGNLVLQGERTLDEKLRSRDFHRMERAYGPFRRTFRVPRGLDTSAVQAEMADGVLTVILPRRSGEEAPVRIPVA